MFYSYKRDPYLRFGDVVKGYISAPTIIKKPISSLVDVESFCNINLEVPVFSVVVTPCCSIEDSMLCITPLVQIRKNFLNNTFFVKDFTVINREIKPEHCYPIKEWEKKSADEKASIEARSKPYTLLNLFVYEKHEMLPMYELRGQTINYYMIDFRNVHTIKCEMIKSAAKMGPGEEAVINSKCLQLSEKTREELRNKMAYYYGRVPDEDIVQRVAVAG